MKVDGQKHEDQKYMSIKELQDAGYLQEVNRLFFHPLGLALGLGRAADGSLGLYGIWDVRHDLEGIIFNSGHIASDEAAAKAAMVREQLKQRISSREKALGYIVQPIGAETGGKENDSRENVKEQKEDS